MLSPDPWLLKLAKLNVYRAKGGRAPHKPLLLLVLLDLAEQDLLPRRELPLTPELAFRFCTFWNVVAYRRTQRPNVRMPFYHLQTDGFWTALGEQREPTNHERFVRYATFNSDFETLARDPLFREKARRILIAGYFQPEEQLALYSLLELPIPSDDELSRGVDHLIPEQAEQKGREGRFRINIVSAYQYACALTGYRLMTVSTGSIIDAAHIHQFSESRNNDVRNGLALSKNAHWLFDNGLWTLADDYTVIVADERFTEDSPDQKPLREYQGQRIRLPDNPAFHPDPEHLDWHRSNIFQRS